MDKRQFITPKELGAIMGRCTRTIYRHIAKRNIPVYRLGRYWYIKKTDLIQLKQ